MTVIEFIKDCDEGTEIAIRHKGEDINIEENKYCSEETVFCTDKTPEYLYNKTIKLIKHNAGYIQLIVL